jgi:hypothetical protein
MEERKRFRKAVLLVLISFTLLLYCLAAASIWARDHATNDPPGAFDSSASSAEATAPISQAPLIFSI